MTDPSSSIVATQITVSGVFIFFMQVAKKVKWIPLNDQTSTEVKRALTIIASGLVAIGIHGTYTWNPQTRIFAPSIHIPTLTDAVFGLGHWVRSYAFTESMYQTYKIGSMAQYLPKILALLDKVNSSETPKP